MDNFDNNNKNLPAKKKDSDKVAKSDEKAELAFKWEYEEEKRKSKKGPPTSLILTMMLSVVFLAAFAFFAVYSVSRTYDTPQSVQDTDTPEYDEDVKTIYVKDASLAEGLMTPQEIYSTVSPSVVSIRATAKGKEGIGTGFVYSKDGYIATVCHVIDGMDNVSVIMPNNKEYKAEVVGKSELCDLALLKIDVNDLRSLTLGRSSSLLVGEELVAIGTPASLEFAGTMTRGDVSYNDREVYVYDESAGTLKKKMTLIQTSAVLNPGNSGGPVFDMHGKVVGIVTMKLGSGFDGIGFAIPIDTAAPILDDMKKGISPTPDKLSAIARYAARIGIKGQNFSGEFDEKTLLGVAIVDFEPKNSDAATKLRIGDVIVSVNGAPISNTSSLSKSLSSYDPDESVTVTVYRKGQLLSFSVRLIN